jgi:hypothetical protein
MAPFRAPPRQHGTAIGRFHPLAKSMRLRPVTVIRLKRTFWHSYSLSQF